MKAKVLALSSSIYCAHGNIILLLQRLITSTLSPATRSAGEAQLLQKTLHLACKKSEAMITGMQLASVKDGSCCPAADAFA